MKVTQIRSFPVRDDSGRLYFIVRVDTDAGIYGLGEVGVARLGRSIALAIDHLSEIVIGSDPWETERLWQQMFRGLFFPAERVYACAISGIDIALWDIKAKSVGMPLYKILGGRRVTKSSATPTSAAKPLKTSSTTPRNTSMKAGNSSGLDNRRPLR